MWPNRKTTITNPVDDRLFFQGIEFHCCSTSAKNSRIIKTVVTITDLGIELELLIVPSLLPDIKLANFYSRYSLRWRWGGNQNMLNTNNKMQWDSFVLISISTCKGISQFYSAIVGHTHIYTYTHTHSIWTNITIVWNTKIALEMDINSNKNHQSKHF